MDPQIQTAPAFRTAKKIDPVYEVAEGDGSTLYKRLLEKDAKDDPEAERFTDSETKKRIWLKRLYPAAK